jgi:hypothetical protein
MTGVKKTPIGEIGKNQKKLTIAEEVEHESTYRFEPSLTPEQLFSCWLDPSERSMAETKCSTLRVDKTRTRIPELAVEALRQYLVPEAFSSGRIKIEITTRHEWRGCINRVKRKFNLTKIEFSTMSQQVNELTISSQQPLYDQDAHANRVRNVLRGIKVRYPNVVFGSPECKQALSCPLGLNDALRKVALETHGK